MSSTDSILTQWEELKVLVESTSVDVAKGGRGNNSAYARVRRSLRDMRKRATALLKEMIAQDKAYAQEKQAEKVKKSQTQ